MTTKPKAKGKKGKKTTVKDWLKQEDVYDKGLETVLKSQGIKNPSTDFKGYTQQQYDELYRKCVVERAKDLKDQKAKVRLEKKLTKIEKFWRKESGIKKTSVKKGQKKTKANKTNTNVSAKPKKNALKKAEALKKFLKTNDCFGTDLLQALVVRGIFAQKDLVKIDSNQVWDEIYNDIRVERDAELKSAAGRKRLEKMMTKFEKLWRKKTGVKPATSMSSKQKKGTVKGKKAAKDKDQEKLTGKGKKLKTWMKKKELFELALFEELLAAKIIDPAQLKDMTEPEFDTIVRKVRVDRVSQLKDKKARKRVDKLLVAFEKEWRKASGIKPQKGKGKGKKGKKKPADETKEEVKEAAAGEAEPEPEPEAVELESKDAAEDTKVQAAQATEFVAAQSAEVITGTLPKKRVSISVKYNLGDRVVIKHDRKGQVKFAGEVKEFGPGTWYGVRLTEERGDTDGEWKEVRKFKCPKNVGIYVQGRLIVGRCKDGEFDFMGEEAVYAAEAQAKAEAFENELDQMKNLKRIFRDADTDNSGTIDRFEFSELAANVFNCTLYESEQLFKKIDVTKNGSISLAEFDAFADKIGGITVEEPAQDEAKDEPEDGKEDAAADEADADAPADADALVADDAEPEQDAEQPEAAAENEADAETEPAAEQVDEAVDEDQAAVEDDAKDEPDEPAEAVEAAEPVEPAEVVDEDGNNDAAAADDEPNDADAADAADDAGDDADADADAGDDAGDDAAADEPAADADAADDAGD